jgi:hypothetical protein
MNELKATRIVGTVRFKTGAKLVFRALGCGEEQGCQIVPFQTKNANLDEFGWAIQWKRFAYFIANWNFLDNFAFLMDIG